MNSLQKILSWISSHSKMLILASIFGYFIARGLEFSLTFLPYIGPDERYHIDLATLFSKRILFPTLADLGDRGFILPPQYLPSLYHFVLGKLLVLNVFGLETYQFLRILNLLLSTATVAILYSFVKLVSKNTNYALFTIAVVTNTPMFSYLSASVNYDNLVNLLAVLSFYFFYKLYKNPISQNIFSLFITLAAGALTKESFLPLALVIGTLTIIVLKKKASLANLINERGTAAVKLKAVVFVLLTFANIFLYGRNLFVYRGLFPQCIQVMSEQRCATTKKAERLKDEHVSPEITRLSIQEYVPIWYFRMNATLLLHGGHKYVWPPLIFVVVSCIFFLLLSLMVVIRTITLPSLYKQFLAISVFYTVFLLVFVYFNSYLPTGFVHRGANGRYLFPLFAPIFVLAHQSLKTISRQWKVLLAACALFFLCTVDYPYFKAHVDTTWTRKWYSLKDESGNPLPDYTYLETSTHTGEPYGWEPR